jgi:hypothetical protein
MFAPSSLRARAPTAPFPPPFSPTFSPHRRPIGITIVIILRKGSTALDVLWLSLCWLPLTPPLRIIPSLPFPRSRPICRPVFVVFVDVTDQIPLSQTLCPPSRPWLLCPIGCGACKETRREGAGRRCTWSRPLVCASVDPEARRALLPSLLLCSSSVVFLLPSPGRLG